MRGSKANDSEVNVAICKAYVDQGCCLLSVSVKWGKNQPGCLLPDMFLGNETGVVASPVATRPAGTLIKEFDIILEGGLNLTFPVVLDPGFRLVGDKPPSDKVVIVSI